MPPPDSLAPAPRRALGLARRLFGSSARKTGLPPGTLIHVGEQKQDKPLITVLDYTEATIEERTGVSVEDCLPYRDRQSNTWINVDGLHDVETVRRLGEHFGLHPLVLEDIGNTNQRPKFEDHETYAFIVLKMLQVDPATGEPHAEQVSIILGPRFVLSFQEKVGDIFDPLRGRLRSGKGLVRRQGIDYLSYRIMDAVVDNYFVILESLGTRLEALEAALLAEPTPELLNDIHRMRNELIYLRRSVWPLREVVASLERAEFKLVRKSTRPYLRDVYDHTIQVIETLETYRDLLGSMLELYMSGVSNRMNEVMKKLTVMASIFLPLTFVAGIYGMNFENMPELSSPYGYVGALLLMAAIALGMVAYFRRKDWL